MYDKDSQLIYETYSRIIVEIDSASSAHVDPLTWGRGDEVTLKIGGVDIKFEYRSYQKDKGGKYYQNLIPVKDYSTYGPLPNIGTGSEGEKIVYKQQPINVLSNVIKGRESNHYNHSTRVVGYKPAMAATAATSAGDTAKEKKPSKQYYDVDAQGRGKMRWTQEPEHRGTFRATAADWKPFETSDAKTWPMKWAAHQLERGWQAALAPGEKTVRSGTSKYATDASKRYTGPDAGDRKWMGSDYEGPAKKTRTGRSKYGA